MSHHRGCAFSDQTCELGQHSHAVARWRRATRSAEVSLARWPANHALKVTRWRVEIFDTLPEKCVRSAQNTKASLLETTIKGWRKNNCVKSKEGCIWVLI